MNEWGFAEKRKIQAGSYRGGTVMRIRESVCVVGAIEGTILRHDITLTEKEEARAREREWGEQLGCRQS